MGGCCGGFGWGAWGHWGSGLGIVGLAVNVLFTLGLLALLGVGIVWAVRMLRRPSRQLFPGEAVDPLEIARRRLAAGEITPEEFETLRKYFGG